MPQNYLFAVAARIIPVIKTEVTLCASRTIHTNALANAQVTDFVESSAKNIFVPCGFTPECCFDIPNALIDITGPFVEYIGLSLLVRCGIISIPDKGMAAPY